MPVMALFYNHCGLDDHQLFVLQSVYSISIVAFEIPSGYLADVLGRRNSLIIGTVLGSVGYLLYSLSAGFWGFLFAQVVLGLGESFVSGADSAMLYDSLSEMKSSHRYLKLEGRVIAIGNFSESIASSIGGGLAVLIGIRAPFVAQVFVALAGVPAAISLVEPRFHATKAKASMMHIAKVFADTLYHNRRLSSSLIVSSVVGTATLTMAWVAQLIFVHQQIGTAWTSALWVALNLCVAVVSLLAGNLVERFGSSALFWVVVCAIPCIYLIIPLVAFGTVLVLLFLFYAVRGVATPVLKDLVNSRCQPQVRATVLSIRSMVIRLLFSFVGPLFGWVAVRQNFTNALFSLGVFFACTLLLAGYYFWKYGNNSSVTED